jgi:Peptidase family M20/M25/M40
MARSGLLLRVGAATGPAVAVRAEMDGLPIAQATGPFAATAGVMHACGHDVHMAALVALNRAARAVEAELPVPLVAVFQEDLHPWHDGYRLSSASAPRSTSCSQGRDDDALRDLDRALELEPGNALAMQARRSLRGARS